MKVGGVAAFVEVHFEPQSPEQVRAVWHVPETNFGKMREALQVAEAALSDIGDADREPCDDLAWCERRAAQDLPAIRQALALPTEPAHADTWGISRALVTLYAYECDGLTGEALAMPTADHLPEAGEMVVDHFPDATKMIEAAAPVGEREAFERTMMDKYGWQRNDFKLDDFGYFDGHTDTSWMAWQARAALSAGDAAVLAEREACAKLCEEVADDLITAMRKDGETDDEAMTSLVASARVCAEEIRGGYSKKFNPHNAAIDAAMRKDKT